MSRSISFLKTRVLAALVLGLAVAQPAMAQDTSSDSPQMKYRRATEAFEQKRWDEARILFLELWNRAKSYDVASSLGLVEYQLKNYAEAAKYYTYAVANIPPMEKPETVDRFNAILQELRGLVGTTKIKVNQPSAEVLIDGKAVGQSPLESELFLNVGPHTIQAKLGDQTDTKTVDVLAGSEHYLEFELQPASSAGVAPPTGETPQPAPEQDSTPKSGGASWAPVIAGGVLTLVGVGAGLGFHFAANSDRDEFDGLVEDIGEGSCGSPSSPAQCSDLPDLAEGYDRKRNFSTAGFVVGGVALIGTATYFFVARPDRATSARGFDVNATASSDGGHFSLSGKF
jgi:hypothetical protein